MVKNFINIHRFIAATVVMIFVGLNVFLFSDHTEFMDIRIKTNRGSFNIKAEVAKSFRQQRRGLMYRERLEVGEGMLFIFNKPLTPVFWMKNTLIPLDMIFIGDDLFIKHIEQKVPPCLPDETCKLYSPPEPVRYVLEVPGGYCKLFGVNKDDTMEFINEG